MQRPRRGKAKWKVPLMETASSAGMLATDGGCGSVNRRMKDYDLIPVGGSVTTFELMPE